MELENIAKAHLEKVWTEYIEYKNYIKDKVKTPDQLRKEVAQEIKTLEDAEKVEEILFEKGQKNVIYQADFSKLLVRLFHTVEAYKDILEIPQEIKTEAENFKFEQILKIKNNTETVVNQPVIDAMKKEIQTHLNELKKFYSV